MFLISDFSHLSEEAADVNVEDANVMFWPHRRIHKWNFDFSNEINIIDNILYGEKILQDKML